MFPILKCTGLAIVALALAACGGASGNDPGVAVKPVALADLPAPWNQGDLSRGGQLFLKCHNCHSLDAAEGDTNLDGLVDISDLQNILASGKYGTGAAAVWADGDFNFDGVVDVSDLQDVLASGVYGQGNYNPALSRFAFRSAGGLGGGMLVPHVVPEPSVSVLLLAAAGTFLALSRRRRR
jgi:hypothetical protein